jgi:hypothetical protein
VREVSDVNNALVLARIVSISASTGGTPVSRPRWIALVLIGVVISAGCTDTSHPLLLTTGISIPSAKPSDPRTAQYNLAITRGVAFLVNSQQPDGSWGTGLETRGTEVYSMVPGSHDAYRIGTTALCVMALREAGEKTAHDKGLEYLLTCQEARRDDGELLYNTWAHIYAVQALAEELLVRKNPRIEAAAKKSLISMNRYATYVGGWNYYDFDNHTQSPSMGPTSFGTAAGLVALHEAKQAGLELPPRLAEGSLRRLEEMRLPNGFFLYGSDYKYIPRIPANLERGAVGRTQPSNYALWLWKSKVATEERIRSGLDAFESDHAFLEMGRKHPTPHISWYQTSGYYYYFDHYYASRLLEALPEMDRRKYADIVAAGVLPHQEPDDGSWWDFAMWDYHKPYGTAFAVMTLLRCK